MDKKTFTHIDLFSGIGGFSLAAKTVWGEAYENLAFVEIDEYCQELLKLRFEGARIYGDIKTFTKERVIADTEGGESWEQTERKGRKDISGGSKKVDLITGGFPCQSFSHAGKRKGTTDNRWLWPEMFRIVSTFKPTWVIGENVFGITSMAEQQEEIDLDNTTDNGEAEDIKDGATGVVWGIISDLEKIGYDVQCFLLPSAGVGAPHLRERIFIVGHSNSKNNIKEQEVCKGENSKSSRTIRKDERCNASNTNSSKPKGKRGKIREEESLQGIDREKLCSRGIERTSSNGDRDITNDATDTNNSRFRNSEESKIEKGLKQRPKSSRVIQRGFEGHTSSPIEQQAFTNTISNGHENGYKETRGEVGESEQGRVLESEREDGGIPYPYGPEISWGRNAIEVARELCVETRVHGVDDGVSATLDRLKLSNKGHRNARLKGLGNSICPQVVIPIMQAMKKMMEEEK